MYLVGGDCKVGFIREFWSVIIRFGHGSLLFDLGMGPLLFDLGMVSLLLYFLNNAIYISRCTHVVASYPYFIERCTPINASVVPILFLVQLHSYDKRSHGRLFSRLRFSSFLFDRRPKRSASQPPMALELEVLLLSSFLFVLRVLSIRHSTSDHFPNRCFYLFSSRRQPPPYAQLPPDPIL